MVSHAFQPRQAQPMQVLPALQNAQIDPRMYEDQRPGLKDIISKGLGEGMGQGLQESIVSSMKQQQYKSAIDRALGGLPSDASAKEIFSAATQLPEGAQQLFANTYMKAREQDIRKQAQSARSLGGTRSPGGQQAASPEQNALFGETLKALNGASSEGEPGEAEPSKTGFEQPGVSKEAGASDVSESEQPKRKGSTISDKQVMDSLKYLTPAQQKIVLDESKEARAASKDYRSDLLSNHRDHIEAKMRLERMKELNRSGDLNTPTWSKIVEGFGLPSSYLSPDSQEFTKLSNDLMKNIRSFYGAKINIPEVQNFMKTIPTLSQSKEGRERIINNLILLDEAHDAYYEAFKDVMKGRTNPPLNLEEMVTERASDRLDDIALRFKEANVAPEEETEEEPIAKKKIEESDTPERPLVGVKEPDAAEVAPSEKEEPGFLQKLRERGRYKAQVGKDGDVVPEIARHAVRTASRVGETVAGFPGDINNFVLAVSDAVPVLKFSTLPNRALKKVLPTSQSLREFSSSITGGYTEPNSELEKIGDEIVQDTSAFMMGGGSSLVKAVGSSLVGQTAKLGTSLFTTSESKQEIAKVGAMILSAMWSPGRAMKLRNALYKEADALLPETASLPNSKLFDRIQEVEDQMIKRGIRPKGSEEALKKLDELKSAATSGEIKISDLIDSKSNLNKYYFDKMPEERAQLDKVKKVLHESLEEYGRENPVWWEKYTAADSAHAALEQSKKWTSNIYDAVKASVKGGKEGISGEKFQKIMPKTWQGKGAGLLALEVPLHAAGHSFLLPGTAGAALALRYPLKKAGEIGYRYVKNQSFRNSYNQLVLAAAKNNRAQIIRSLNKLEQVPEKKSNKKTKLKNKE